MKLEEWREGNHVKSQGKRAQGEGSVLEALWSLGHRKSSRNKTMWWEADSGAFRASEKQDPLCTLELVVLSAVPELGITWLGQQTQVQHLTLPWAS
jgi:hypothetical protein